MPVEGESSARFALSAGSSARTCGAEPEEVVEAVRLRLCLERRKLGDLALVGGDDQLAAAPVLHAVLAAEAAKHHLALDAEPGLGKARRAIDASVDDFAVARAHPGPDGVFRLDDDDLPASPRQRARDRETDHSGADDEAFDGVHGSLQARRGGDAQQPAGAAGQTNTMPPSDMMTCPVI